MTDNPTSRWRRQRGRHPQQTATILTLLLVHLQYKRLSIIYTVASFFTYIHSGILHWQAFSGGLQGSVYSDAIFLASCCPPQHILDSLRQFLKCPGKQDNVGSLKPLGGDLKTPSGSNRFEPTSPLTR